MKKNKHWAEEAEKVFISGKITGERIDECFYKFSEAWSYIVALTKVNQIIDIVNPLRLKGIYFEKLNNSAELMASGGDKSNEQLMNIVMKTSKALDEVFGV